MILLIIRVKIEYILWNIGLVKILPRQVINGIAIEDCGEPLIQMEDTDRLLKSHYIVSEISIRKTVFERLKQATSYLPPDMFLAVLEGYRSTERQQNLWNARFVEVRRENPNADTNELERITRLSVAKPQGVGGGHQTGGAIDVTLCDKMGKFLDMGTQVQEFNEKTPSFYRRLPAEVLSKRQLLIEAMQRAGFVNYPGEWWHFSYGDQMWAAYGKHSKAIFGPI